MHRNQGSSCKVLLVDPDLLFVAWVSTMLLTDGYQVVSTSTIAEAVRALKDVDFGCVIMDEGLPEIKGYFAVPIIKAMAPGIPVIMTASHNSSELETEIRKQDVFFYHCKAFALNDLKIAVANAFRKRNSWEHNEIGT